VNENKIIFSFSAMTVDSLFWLSIGLCFSFGGISYPEPVSGLWAIAVVAIKIARQKITNPVILLTCAIITPLKRVNKSTIDSYYQIIKIFYYCFIWFVVKV
jgi:hypothetical protein